MPQVDLIGTTAKPVKRDKQRLRVVRSKILKLLVSEVRRPRRSAIVAHTHGILKQTFVLGAAVLGFHSVLCGWRCNYEVNCEVSFEFGVFGGEDAAFVVELGACGFHACPEGLEVAIP